MSARRWTLYLCLNSGSPHYCSCDPQYDAEGIAHCDCHAEQEIEVVPESELSLSLAREQRLREAITSALTLLEVYPHDDEKVFGILDHALSSVSDGEGS